MIPLNINRIRERIRRAATKAGRRPEDVKLLLATKTVTAGGIREAAEYGELLMGENKVQELKQKHEALHDLPLNKHFIGHLQSNKVKDVLQYVSCIESLDRPSLAIALQKKLSQSDSYIDVMIQVNSSFEASKFGLKPDDALTFAASLKNYDRLRIKGFMTIGLFDADPEKVRPSFALLRQIKEEAIAQKILSPEEAFHLSMGMSNDLETAIEEGATIVRVGTAIFGKRALPDSYYWNEKA